MDVERQTTERGRETLEKSQICDRRVKAIYLASVGLAKSRGKALPLNTARVPRIRKRSEDERKLVAKS